MKLNEDDYIGSRSTCIGIMKNKGKSEINMISATSGVPLMMLAIWYLREVDDDPEVHEMIERLQDFYEYDEIVTDPLK